MDSPWRQDMARRAGVELEYVDRLVELAILKPGTGDASAGDVRRARWVLSLEQAGVPLDELGTAGRDGALSFSFLDASAFDRFAGLSSTTFRDLSARTGIPLELLMVVREALGFAEPRPEDQVREDELSIVPVIELQLSSGCSGPPLSSGGSGRVVTTCAGSLRPRRTGTRPRSCSPSSRPA